MGETAAQTGAHTGERAAALTRAGGVAAQGEQASAAAAAFERERTFGAEAAALLEERLAAAVGLTGGTKAKLRRLLTVREGDGARYGDIEGYGEAVARAFDAEAECLDALVAEEWG